MLDSRKPCDLYGGFLPTFRANSTAQKTTRPLFGQNFQYFPSVNNLSFFFLRFSQSRLRHGWLLPSIRARQTAAAFAKTQGAVIHVFYHSALTLACVVVRLFRRCKHRPLSKMLSSQIFCHNISLRSIRSALPIKSGDTQGTHASRRTSPAQCEAGCPPALQKRSDCVRRP